MIFSNARRMCPASDRPNLGLFDQAPVVPVEAEFTIDVAAGALLDANAGGWVTWGLDPASAAPPYAIDVAMPALERLREIAAGRRWRRLFPER